MKKMIVMILGMVLAGPVLWGQGLDEINVVEMSWRLSIYQGARMGSPPAAGVVSSSYSKPEFFENLGRDEDQARERGLIKTTFNLADVRLVSQGELWLKEAQGIDKMQFARQGAPLLIMEIERLDLSWLHYRITVSEGNGDKKMLVRSAFTVPNSMTMKDAVVFGFDDSARSPLFVSLRIGNLYAEGAGFKKDGGQDSAKKAPGMALAASKEEFDRKAREFEKGAVACRGEIKPPRLISAVDPEYPSAAKTAGIEGVVIFAVKADERGHVIGTLLLRSIPELDAAALDAVRKRVFEPLKIEGRPRACVFTSTVTFRLDAGKPAPGGVKEKGAVQAPRLTQYVPPVYPEAAKAKGIEGVVVLSVTIDAAGSVLAARVIKSIPELDQAAIEAVKRWKYEPMLANGKPRGVIFAVSVEFKR